jgi:hypothetical protein
MSAVFDYPYQCGVGSRPALYITKKGALDSQPSNQSEGSMFSREATILWLFSTVGETRGDHANQYG